MQWLIKYNGKNALLTLFIFLSCQAKASEIFGTVLDMEQKPVSNTTITIKEAQKQTVSDDQGRFYFSNLDNGIFTLTLNHDLYNKTTHIVSVNGSKASVTIYLIPRTTQLKAVDISYTRPIGRGKEISEDEISLGKQKIVLKPQAQKKVSSSLTRSIDAPVNIIEYDGAGLQLGIGGRGLNPKRTAHYNTRQNGYEISADALGYPETYYTPPIEAISEIDLLRGAASLQYGPQFGGMINFKLKEGPSKKNKKIEFVSNNRYGSYNQFHSFNSLATKKNKLSSYSFYHYKTGDGWRVNAHYNSHTGFIGLKHQTTKKLQLKLQLTHHRYVAQQAGGLTDKQFNDDPQQSFRERNWFNVDWSIAALIAHYKITKDSWINSKTFLVNASRNSVGFLENSSRIDFNNERLIILGDFQNIGNETRWITRYKIGNKNAALISGIRLYKGWAQTAQALGTANSNADFKLSNEPEYSQYQFPSSNVSAFAENTFFLNKNLYLTPGYRFEYIDTKVDGYYNYYVVNNANDTLLSSKNLNQSVQTRNIHLFGTGLTYIASSNGKFIANFSKNFRSVNFSDINIAIPSFRVDPNIEDERGFTADLNYNKGWNKKGFLGITGYYLYYANRIGLIWQTDDLTFDTFQYRTNVSASRTFGMELTSWIDLAQVTALNGAKQKLNLLTNVTVNNAKYTDTNSIVFGNWVEMVPAITIKSSLTYEYKNWLVTGLVNFQTQQYAESTNATESTTGLYGIIPAFYVIDTKVGYNFKKITLQVSANNVTDKKYFTQRANSYPGPGIIPSEGIIYWGSIIFNL